MAKVLRSGISVAVLLGLLANAATAMPISDPMGDLLASFVPGDPVPTAHPDVDVVEAEVIFNNATNEFTFIGKHAGAIGSSLNDAGLPGAVYVWGINRGEGLELLADISDGVLFDSVVVLNANGTGIFLDLFLGGAPKPIDPSKITISGDTISGVVSGADIPSLGKFVPGAYEWNLWPRFLFDSTANILTDPAVSDFAPDSGTEVVTLVSEPSLLGLLAVGSLGWLAARRRRAA